MTPQAAAGAITDESLAAMRARRGFRAACELAAAGTNAGYQALDPRYRWVTHDLGRSMICGVAVVLHMAGLLTAQNLTATCRVSTSPGRVSQVLRRLIDMDAVTVAPGDEPWRRRPMTVSRQLTEALTSHGRVNLTAALTMFPAEAGLARVLEADDSAMAFSMAIGVEMDTRPDLFRDAVKTSVDHFLEREAGGLVLCDLLTRQAPARARLLEAAPLSRQALGRAYNVSRAHVSRLLRESGEVELGRDRVIFSPRLSADFERHFAVIFHLDLGAARAVAAGWRAPGQPPGEPIELARSA